MSAEEEEEMSPEMAGCDEPPTLIIVAIKSTTTMDVSMGPDQ